MNKKAFTLVELLVYTFLFSVFVLATFGLCSVMVTSLHTHRIMATTQVYNALALDCIRRDLMGASMRLECWDNVQGVCVKEQLDEKGKAVDVCVGWEVIPGKTTGTFLLRRSEGCYNFASKQWKIRTMSWLPSSLMALEYRVELSEDRQRVIRVYVVAHTDNKTIRQTVALRNRRL